MALESLIILTFSESKLSTYMKGYNDTSKA